LKLCEYQISQSINSWNGVDLSKKTQISPYTEFREYFTVAKNWWDQKKTAILGTVLWGPILYDIKKFVMNEDVLYKILNGLFNANVKFANTKQQPLIPNGAIKNSKEIKNFLFCLDDSLDIDGWLKQDILHKKQLDVTLNKWTKRRTGDAQMIANKLRVNLHKLANKSHSKNANTTTSTKNNEIVNDRRKTQKQTQCISNIITNNNNHIITNSNIDNNYNAIIFALADKFIADNNNNCNNFTAFSMQQQPMQSVMSYNGSHNGSYQYRVSGQRYNPLNNLNYNLNGMNRNFPM